jgi:hypothetical protein
MFVVFLWFLPGTERLLSLTCASPAQLPYRVRWQDLKDLFRKAGTVLRADVSLGPDNRSRGYGTVLLASAEDAKKAIGELKLQFKFSDPSCLRFLCFLSHGITCLIRHV